jgi:hypothetical protein
LSSKEVSGGRALVDAGVEEEALEVVLAQGELELSLNTSAIPTSRELGESILD